VVGDRQPWTFGSLGTGNTLGAGEAERQHGPQGLGQKELLLTQTLL